MQSASAKEWLAAVDPPPYAELFELQKAIRSSAQIQAKRGRVGFPLFEAIPSRRGRPLSTQCRLKIEEDL